MLIALLFIFILLQIVDCYTTIHILGKGGKEANPILAWLFTKIGIPETLSIMKCVVIAALLVLTKLVDTTTSLWVLGICNLMYVGVIGWNSYQIFKK